MRFPLFAILLALLPVLPAQTGTAVPALAALDRAMTNYLSKTKTNGGSHRNSNRSPNKRA